MFFTPHLTSVCVLCNTLHRERYAVCELCLHDLPRLGPSCITCTKLLPRAQSLHCQACVRQKPALDFILCAHRFSTPLRHLLHQFKYHQALYLAPVLAALMRQALPIHYTTECLIPIPMHSTQLKRRGFNQTQLLAHCLSRAIQRPVIHQLCTKIRETAHQAGLSARARKANLAQAFNVLPTHLQHVTLVDDLITTGSTANELARLLKQNGVKQVDLWCCAKAVAI